MTQIRCAPLALAITVAVVLAACNTPPPMPPGEMERMGKMDAQMRNMQAMHEKMMNAKTPDERTKLMADHMSAMQGGMEMMGEMPSVADDRDAHHKMMSMRMKMMQSMMTMMMDRMPPSPSK